MGGQVGRARLDVNRNCALRAAGLAPTPVLDGEIVKQLTGSSRPWLVVLFRVALGAF
jgi:hypothetical protein